MASTLEALERYPVPHSTAKLMTREWLDVLVYLAQEWSTLVKKRL